MKKGILGSWMALVLLISVPVFGEPLLPQLAKQGQTVESFVPKGWTLLDQTSGDLNKDGLADIVGVIEPEAERQPGEEAPARILFVAFRGKEPGYRLAIQTSKAIMRADEGGMLGDPYDDGSISVDRGSLVLSFYGGSSWRWRCVYRFRYQDRGWYLIGVTQEGFRVDSEATTMKDYNLLTGKMIESQTNEAGDEQQKVIHRGKKKLVNLTDFDVSGSEEQF